MTSLVGTTFWYQSRAGSLWHPRVVLYFVACFKNSTSGIQPFQFEPTHPPGEEPIDSEEESQEEESVANLTTRIGNIEWCICGGNCESMSTAEEKLSLLSRVRRA